MLNDYRCLTENDYENALKEIMQEVALIGLWRAKFFEHAALRWYCASYFISTESF